MDKIFFIVLILMTAAACQKKGGEVAQSVPAIKQGESPNPTTVSNGLLDLRAEAKAHDEPNHYSIVLSWKVSQTPQMFLLKRSDWKDARTIPPHQLHFTDVDVSAGEHYKYELSAITTAQDGATDTLTVKVPKDIVYDKTHTDIRSIVGFNRVFLKSGVTLFWQGERLEIITNELIAENAILESFSADEQTAAPGNPGRNGGELILKATTLKGKLIVRGNGQKGGQGLPGIQGETGNRGGAQRKALLKEKIQTPCGTHYYISDSALARQCLYCDIINQGSPGGTGRKGGLGRTGKDGGASAILKIEITNLDPKNFQVVAIGGSGGEGGPGGPGGAGGEPGPIPDIDWTSERIFLHGPAPFGEYQNCRETKGPQGPSGPIGDLGPTGNNGYQIRPCVRLGSSPSEGC